MLLNNRLESIIDFRVKELNAKIVVIEKFESQVATLTEVVRDLEEKLPGALEQGISHDQPEALMVLKSVLAVFLWLAFSFLTFPSFLQNLRKDFDETVRKVKSVEEEIATDFGSLNLAIPRLVTEEVSSNEFGGVYS